MVSSVRICVRRNRVLSWTRDESLRTSPRHHITRHHTTSLDKLLQISVGRRKKIQNTDENVSPWIYLLSLGMGGSTNQWWTYHTAGWCFVSKGFWKAHQSHFQATVSNFCTYLSSSLRWVSLLERGTELEQCIQTIYIVCDGIRIDRQWTLGTTSKINWFGNEKERWWAIESNSKSVSWLNCTLYSRVYELQQQQKFSLVIFFYFFYFSKTIN